MELKLNLDDPSTSEEIKAKMQLKAGKSYVINGIPGKVYQYRGEAVLDMLQNLVTNCWKKGTLLQDLRDAVTLSQYNTKETNQNVPTIVVEFIWDS